MTIEWPLAVVAGGTFTRATRGHGLATGAALLLVAARGKVVVTAGGEAHGAGPAPQGRVRYPRPCSARDARGGSPGPGRRGHPGPWSPADRRADSRAMSIRELTPSLRRMWETWVATVRRDSSSLVAISGLDRPSTTSAATLVSVGVRLSQPLRAWRCLACGPRRMPWA